MFSLHVIPTQAKFLCQALDSAFSLVGMSELTKFLSKLSCSTHSLDAIPYGLPKEITPVVAPFLPLLYHCAQYWHALGLCPCNLLILIYIHFLTHLTQTHVFKYSQSTENSSLVSQS